jgi:hypothetical protein
VGGGRDRLVVIPQDIVAGADPEPSVEIAEGGEEVSVIRKPVLCAGITHLHTFIPAISLAGEGQRAMCPETTHTVPDRVIMA